ncbi:MAG: FAD-dependent oxidoreductase [Alcanivoracaceae bacterium]|nr:FAD-dependent oxidoreductase [Alcanivoracaceae bacterium]
MVATATMQQPDVANQLPNDSESPIVIVGNGPSGMQCLVQLRRLGVRTPILLFGKERWAPYDRVKLSSFLAGSASFDSLSNLPEEINDDVVHYVGREIIAIDASAKTVSDNVGETHCFSRLVLALGSRAYIPNLPGTQLAGVFRFRDMADAHALMARTTRSRHTVVIGGGLLGIEAARGLCRFHTDVTLIQHSERLMNRQLDAEAASIVHHALEGEGVRVLLQTPIKSIGGRDRVEHVLLANGEKIHCDSVVFATGISPNRELADQAGVRIAQGVRVDEHMCTSLADIYAVGECAQFGDHISGLVAPGLHQARIAAAHIAGNAEAYAPVADTTWLKVLSLEVFSAGEFREESRFRIHRTAVFRNRSKGLYRRIMMRGGRVVGVVSIGEWPERAQAMTLLRENRRIFPWHILRFYLTGKTSAESNSHHVENWPSTAIVCQCKSISRGEMSTVLQRFALHDAAERKDHIQKVTGAGTVCGGCDALLDNLCGAPTEAKRQVPGAKVLGVVGMLTALFMGLSFLQPMPSVATAIADQSMFEMWSRDSLLRQISGYGLLSASLLTLFLSLRKRVPILSLGAFSSWRMVHSVVGLCAVLLLLWHTGFSLGQNLNRWLMTSYLMVLGWGGMVALLALAESTFAGRWPANWRRRMTWLHIIVFWPVPVLLGFHILSVYYF